MCCGQLWSDAESLAEVIHDLQGKLWAMITDDSPRKSMILPYVEEIEFCSVQSCGSLIAWDELCLFGEVVDDSEDGVEAVGEGKISDEVHTDIHHRHHAWLKWDGGAGRLCVASFEVSALITVRDMGVNVRGQSGPIVLAFNEFLGFLIPWMSGDRGVMVESDYLHVKALGIGNIHPTGFIVEEAILFLADSFLLA